MFLVNDLRRVRELLDKGGWCQGFFKLGGSYCLAGAINEVASGDVLGNSDMRLAIWRAAPEIESEGMTNWNDREGRTKEDVLVVIDKAIALVMDP